MFSYKTAFYAGHTDCFPGYSFANGWQSNTYYIEGNKMIKVQRGNKEVVTVWEFTDTFMVMTITVENVVARKFYERTHDTLSGISSCMEKWCVD